MASADKKTRTVTETTITLTLTFAEAEALAAVVGHVGGEIASTPRRHTDAVFWALYQAGVDVTRRTGDHPGRQISGSLTFHKSSSEAQRRSSGFTGSSDVLKGLGY